MFNGSSPRVRGTRLVVAQRVDLFPVHPRGCGERKMRHGLHGWIGGSSPRVRGTRRHSSERTDMQRFIPAGAGNAP